MRASAGPVASRLQTETTDPDTAWRDLPLADARTRIEDAIELGAMMLPAYESSALAPFPGERIADTVRVNVIAGRAGPPRQGAVATGAAYRHRPSGARRPSVGPHLAQTTPSGKRSQSR